MKTTSHEHGTILSYIIGFCISIALSLLPFLMVEMHVSSQHATFSHTLLLVVITLSALVQLLVQLAFFFHVWHGKGSRWNTLAFAFMLLFVGIIVMGSLWIMYNLSVRMMPQSEAQMEHYVGSQDDL
jgi:cytochrome o ubiquinol oxidase subunit IV